MVRIAVTLAPKLLRAYRRTTYQAAGINVRIGQRSTEADRLLRLHGARTAVFITAYNPYSRLMPLRWNQRKQQQLRQALRRRDCICGCGTLARWSEAHWLVFGDPRPIHTLARRYRQNGIVIMRREQPAGLVLCS